MKDIAIYLVWPMIVCLGIMQISVDTYKSKIEPNESSFFRIHGKKFAWVITFIINMTLIILLLGFHRLYIEREYLHLPDKSDISIECDTIQNEIVSSNIPVKKNKKKTIKSNSFITHVTLTSYNPAVSQCDSDPLITADGTKIDLVKLKKKEIKYCAVSRDLLAFLPYGSTIYVDGHGEYKVKDTMNKRYDHCIDILQHVGEKNFKKTKVKIIKIA